VISGPDRKVRGMRATLTAVVAFVAPLGLGFEVDCPTGPVVFPSETTEEFAQQIKAGDFEGHPGVLYEPQFSFDLEPVARLVCGPGFDEIDEEPYHSAIGVDLDLFKETCVRVSEEFGQTPLGVKFAAEQNDPASSASRPLSVLITRTAIVDVSRPYLQFYLASNMSTTLSVIISQDQNPLSSPFQLPDVDLTNFESMYEDCEATGAWRRVKILLLPIINAFEHFVQLNSTANELCTSNCLDPRLDVELEVRVEMDDYGLAAVDGFEFVGPPLENASAYTNRSIHVAEEIEVQSFKLRDPSDILFLALPLLIVVGMVASLAYKRKTSVKTEINLIAATWLIVSVIIAVYAYVQFTNFQEDFDAFVRANNLVSESFAVALEQLHPSELATKVTPFPFGSAQILLPFFSESQVRDLFDFQHGELGIVDPCNLTISDSDGTPQNVSCVGGNLTAFFLNYGEPIDTNFGTGLDPSPLIFRMEARLELSRVLNALQVSLLLDFVVSGVQVLFWIGACATREKVRRRFYLVIEWSCVAVSIGFLIFILYLLSFNSVDYVIDGALVRYGDAFIEASPFVDQSLTTSIAVSAIPKALEVTRGGGLKMALPPSTERCFLSDFTTFSGRGEGISFQQARLSAAQQAYFERGLDPAQCDPLRFDLESACVSIACTDLTLVTDDSIKPVIDFIKSNVVLGIVLFDIFVTVIDFILALVVTIYKPHFYDNKNALKPHRRNEESKKITSALGSQHTVASSDFEEQFPDTVSLSSSDNEGVVETGFEDIEEKVRSEHGLSI